MAQAEDHFEIRPTSSTGMSINKTGIGGWPSENACLHSRNLSWDQAVKWMKQDRSDRVIEGVQKFLHHEQVCWERCDKSRPMGFKYGSGDRWLNYYDDALQPGGCLHGSGVHMGGHSAGIWDKAKDNAVQEGGKVAVSLSAASISAILAALPRS